MALACLLRGKMSDRKNKSRQTFPDRYDVYYENDTKFLSVQNRIQIIDRRDNFGHFGI